MAKQYFDTTKQRSTAPRIPVSKPFTMSSPNRGQYRPVPDFKLKIPMSIYVILLYIRQQVHPYEFAFEGMVEIISDETAFRLKKIYIPFQTASHCSVQYNTPVCEIAPDEELEFLTLHGHSHANMDACWSAVDERDIEDWPGPYRINLVINNYGKMLARIDFFSDVCGKNIRVGTANVRVELEFSEEFASSYSEPLKRIRRVSAFMDATNTKRVARSPALIKNSHQTEGNTADVCNYYGYDVFFSNDDYTGYDGEYNPQLFEEEEATVNNDGVF